MFLSNEDVFPRLKLFFIHPYEKIIILSSDFENSTLCLHMSTPRREDDLLSILRIINFLHFSSRINDFVALDKMQVNI